ncbi:hypothetical protein [uncultured Polaribacter sp.]|uniref:hypothetical protein n=1 Tax=uncultured Polaribacter sp. TaxID=174711 RepID=UPI0026295CE5|nr:hypothetical protein [uncultured Polaribacter sp.]
MKKRNKFLVWLKSNRTLKELDHFYKDIVCQLSKEERKVYCENLIGRLQEDLKVATTKVELNKIKKYIDATKKELKVLKK